MQTSPAIADVLAGVGDRLRSARTRRGVTLTELAAETGISKSTLSRLETGGRRPSLDLLLPVAEALGVSLDTLVGAPEVRDPRILPRPEVRNGRMVVRLTGRTGGLHAWKVIIPPERHAPALRAHEGFEWLYVLSGRMRLLLGDEDLTMEPGEVVEFDTATPHWFGPADDEPIEVLSLHGARGERLRIRAAGAGDPSTGPGESSLT